MCRIGHDTGKGGPTSSGANKQHPSHHSDMDTVTKGGHGPKYVLAIIFCGTGFCERQEAKNYIFFFAENNISCQELIIFANTWGPYGNPHDPDLMPDAIKASRICCSLFFFGGFRPWRAGEAGPPEDRRQISRN